LLLVEAEGYFVGTTAGGGDTKCPGGGCGTVFKLAPNSGGGWTETVLYDFRGAPDGESPGGELTRDAQGYLYGVTGVGGTSNLGTVFKVRARKEIVLHSFAGGADGKNPGSGLLRDSAGNLYGTTWQGGGTGCPGHNGCGTVFKVDASGHETVLHAFTVGAGGFFPQDRLVADPAGNLYGTTIYGGEKPYSGTVFKLDTTGKETVLYNFLGGADGRNPVAGLAIDAAGNLYGSTSRGGLDTCLSYRSCGILFKLTPH
jgi:uncharacterized repeat protein (TIGR03803 family)